MHQLLLRQLKRHAPLGPGDAPPEWRAFLDAVSEAYAAFEADQRMVERSLELSSAELNEKNTQIERQREELSRSNTELEHFAYIASHDLQEPLRTVQSYLQLIRRRYAPKLDQDANEFIDFAVEGATRMRTLIEDLLTYARVSSKARPLEPVALGAALDDVVRALEVRIREKEATITSSALPEVMADQRQLAQLLQNLIANAVKFQKPGEKPVITVSAERRDGDWLVRVKDNGIGMAPEYKEKIFVIFQRLHGRDEYEGTGLGLAVCKKIVERHGGNIWVESEVGKGATFLFTLKAAHDESGKAP